MTTTIYPQGPFSNDRLDPLPAPLSDNAKSALLNVTGKWLADCERTIKLDSLDHTTATKN